MESRNVSANGKRLHYLEGGQPGGQPVVFVHGLTGDAHTWDLLLDPFLSDFRVIAVDLRGHGDSEWATYEPDGYRTAAFVRDLAELVGALDLPPVHVIGHSLGARIGIVLAAEHPALARSLALCDTLPEVPESGALWVRDYIGKRTSARGFRDLAEVEAFIREGNEGWRPDWYGHLAATSCRQNWVGKWVLKFDPQLFWVTTGAASRVDTPYFWECASRLTTPTLAMWGRQSQLVDRALVDRILAASNAVSAVSFDTGHYIMRERPEEWADAALRFIKGS